MRTRHLTPNIVISNLPQDVTASDLAELFDDFGLVLTAWIGTPRSTVTLPARGWVDLAPAASVERAIASLNGRVFRDHKLKVKKAPPPPARRVAKDKTLPAGESLRGRPLDATLVGAKAGGG